MKYIMILSTACILISMLGCSSRPLDYRQLHSDALVVDLHSDSVLRMKDGIDFAVRDTSGHMDIPRLQEGGIDLQVFACWLNTNTPLEECRAVVDELIDSLEVQVKRNPETIAICKTATEAESLIQEGKIAAFIGIENGVAIANDLDNLQHFYDRGVRYMTLTHTASNDWCISSADTAEAFYGLTDFGRDVVRKMNELGMIIDISHASPSAVEEILKITTDPVIASHSCVYNLCDHNRNLTDEQIKAVAANGGMIGVNFYNAYISAEYNAAADSIWDQHQVEVDSLRELYQDDDSLRRGAIRPIYRSIREQLKQVGVSVEDVVDHIDYIVKLVGPEFVGLGSDYDGVPSMPTGLDDCSLFPNLTRVMVERGYHEEDIRKILGGNFMRVFGQVCD